MLAKIDKLHHEAETIFGRAYLLGHSFGHIRFLIARNFERQGVEPPEDVLAFATGGLLSDSNVRDWKASLAA